MAKNYGLSKYGRLAGISKNVWASRCNTRGVPASSINKPKREGPHFELLDKVQEVSLGAEAEEEGELDKHYSSFLNRLGMGVGRTAR